MKQFVTLVWKEWKQLRGVRWSALLLGLVLVLVLCSAALVGQTGERNALGFRTPGFDEIAFELAPVVYAALLWPLFCLLTVVQAFAGDRSIRCEDFLLLQPVSRARVWWARALTSLVSYALTVGLSALPLLGLMLLNDGAPETSWSYFWTGLKAQVLVFPLALAGGSATAALGMTSFAALGMALALGLVVLGTAVWLPSALVFARAALSPWYGAAFALPPILGLLGSSLWTQSRGEPAGLGAWKRALPLVLSSVCLPPVAYVLLSAPLFEWSERRSTEKGIVSAAVPGFAVEQGQGAFLVDTRTLERKVYLPPFIYRGGIDIRGDARRVAVVQEETFMGLQLSGATVLRVFDESGNEILEMNRDHFGCHPITPSWVGEALLVECFDDKAGAVFLVDLDTAEARRVRDTARGFMGWEGRDIRGRHLTRVLARADDGEWMSSLVEFDEKKGAIQSEALVENVREGYYLPGFGLSPSGRYFPLDAQGVVDLETMERVDLPCAGEQTKGRWHSILQGDRLLRWCGTREGDEPSRLELVEIASGAIQVLGQWQDRERVEVSPDRKHVLAMVMRKHEGDRPGWYRVETLLVNVETGARESLEHEFFDWLGPDALIATVDGRLKVWRLGDDPDTLQELR